MKQQEGNINNNGGHNHFFGGKSFTEIPKEERNRLEDSIRAKRERMRKGEGGVVFTEEEEEFMDKIEHPYLTDDDQPYPKRH